MGPELLKGLLFCWTRELVRSGPAFSYKEVSHTAQGCCCLWKTPAEHEAIFVGGLPSPGRRTDYIAKAANTSEDGGRDRGIGVELVAVMADT